MPVVAVAIACCGREDIELLGNPQRDAGIPASDAEGAQGDGAPAEASLDAALDSVHDAAEAACSFASAHACLEKGQGCTASADCCTGRCDQGVCLAPGTCSGPGVSCTARSECCSGRCEPVPGSGRRSCLNYCLPVGAACTWSLDCCAMACRGGVCVAGHSCIVVGQDCVDGAECCSGFCSADADAGQSGLCTADPAAPCSPTGEACGACCGACDAVGRCDFGPGSCRAIGALCEQDGDCCVGQCRAVNYPDETICDATCSTDGAACTQDAECCSTNCTGSPPRCAPATSSCGRTGTACSTSAECCTGECLDGLCGSNCAGD
jgi:hypothetical protein